MSGNLIKMAVQLIALNDHPPRFADSTHSAEVERRFRKITGIEPVDIRTLADRELYRPVQGTLLGCVQWKRNFALAD